MKYLITTTYYEEFISEFYSTHSGISETSYADQLLVLLQQCFGTSDFFSWNLQNLGHQSTEILVNAQILQQRWALESARDLGFPTRPEEVYAWQHQVLQRQIETYRPDILYIHDINWTQEELLRSVRPFVKLIIGQNACPLRSNLDFRVYDLVLTSFPHYVSRFRNQGTQSEYFQLAFEPRVLSKIQKNYPSYNTSFIGGFSPNHQAGIQIFEAVARQTPIDCWGYGGSLLPDDWSLKQRYHGEAWGLKMFQLLANSKMALNRHIDVAERYANNMRLYEATGVGTCLVTDAKDNLHELFEPDREVVTYRNAAECIEKVRYLLDHESERAAIARAGQARTLRDHTYRHRMAELDAIVHRYLSGRDPHPTVVSLVTKGEKNRPAGSQPVPATAAQPAPPSTIATGESDREMFWDDIRLVTQQVEKYGCQQPFVDLGGLAQPVIADYDLTVGTGDQQARFVGLQQRPFDHIAPGYAIINPENGEPYIEELPAKYPEAFGTAVCLSVLEHVNNPFEIFEAFHKIMRPDGLLILSTVFSYPYHPSPNDYWRYTPDCLRYLAQSVGFRVLECDWRLMIPADRGIRAVQDGNLLEVKSVYATLAREQFVPKPLGRTLELPLRISRNPAANDLVAQERQTRSSQAATPQGHAPVLFQVDWPDHPDLDQHRLVIAQQLATAGHTLTCITPNPKPQGGFNQRSLPYNPQTEFHLGMGDRVSFEQWVNEIRPELIIFGDACPLSNFAAKQVARDRGIPYVIVVASADPTVAHNFAPCLTDLAELYHHARQVITLTADTQATLQQHFGLTHPNTTSLNLALTWDPFIPAIQVRSAPPPAPAMASNPANSSPPPNRPEWEYLPQGWQTQDPHILGWNVQSILETQRTKWDAFAAALRTTSPLGISHESPNVTAASYGSHNTMMAFGYVLALAARKKDRISILDWGGGLGQYCLIAQALLPDVEIDYHCKDLPLLCQGGRQLLPQATFYEDEVACFQRRYDLVLSSSSLQYCQDWQTILGRLATVTDQYLYLTRLPVVHQAQSFVVVQRPYAYGYHTEYIGWFLNRQAVLDCAGRSHLQLQREFLIAEQFAVPGAPETAEARGFLFKSI